MKLRLFVVAVASPIFFIGISSVESNGKRGPSKDREICKKLACEIAAKDLKRYMDTCYDPCDDFHKFVCGNFIEEAIIREGREGNTSFDQIDFIIEERFSTILETKFCEGCTLMDYYKSCMNTSAIEIGGEEPMTTVLGELFGGWPLVDGLWDESKADLTNVMTTMLKYSLPNFFDVSVSVDEKNSSLRITTMKQKSLLKFSPSYYTDENCNDEMDAYKTSITKVAKTLSKAKGKAKNNETEKNAEDIIALETNLSKILYPPEESNHLNQEKITLCSLAIKFKEVVNMTAITEKLFEDLGIKIDGEELIAIYGLGYFDKLAKLLKETSKRTVINYLIWKMFNALLITMPRKYQDYANEPEKVKSGASEVPPRREICHSLVSRQYLEAIYVKKYVSKTAKDKVKSMIPKLKKTFESLLSDITWLLPKTKSIVLERIRKIEEIIGYPDYYDKKNFFEEMFNNVDYPESGGFLRKHLHYRAADIDEVYKLLRTSVVPDKYDVLLVNLGYNLENNALFSPAATMQWPFFSEDLPMYLNYAATGTLFAQGIAVGSSPYGAAHYELVNLQPWWTEEDTANFVNYSKCIEEMYSNFVVEEINKKLNGSTHLLSNVGGNRGIIASFMAYQSWTEENGEEPKLPDLDFTPEQLFFINYGRFLCEKLLPTTLESGLTDYAHPLGRFRINGPLMNMKEFSEVFKCKPNSPMNPEKKCKVW